MLVVLSIIAIVTAIALFGQGTFNRSILLTDAAYTLALSVREAQTLGYSSRVFGSTQNAGYGTSFSSSDVTRYVMFADISPVAPGSTVGGACGGHTVLTGPEAKPGDCAYTPSSDGLVRTYTFERGFRISQICGYEGTTRRCSTDGSNTLSIVNIVFLRSSPDSLIMGYRGTTWVALNSAEIYLVSADGGATRGICVSRAGQVSVTAGTCS